LSGAQSSQTAQNVTIHVPSHYISQQSSALDVTLVRRARTGPLRVLGPLTVNFTASPGSLPAGVATTAATTGEQFVPVDGLVTFPAAATTETVVVPLNANAANPGLVPIRLTVTSASQRLRSDNSTVYLASTTSAIPPSIVGVERVRGGIAVTFSKPMGRSSVQNIHNYAVKFSPSQQFNPLYVTGVGLVQELATTSHAIALRRAAYNPDTGTVILIPKERLQSNGSYQISSPASLRANANRPHKAHPLTDLQGNALDEGGSTPGAFLITISKGHPYTAAAPSLANGA
jgi:hypothetical protein